MATAKKIVMAAAGAGYSGDKFILLDTITGNTSQNVWVNYSYDSTDGLPGGTTGRLLIHHVAPTTYTSDQQVDDVNIDGTLYNFDSNATGWQYVIRDPFLSALSDDAARISAYDAYSFSNVATATSGNGQWLRDNAGTGSTGTGSTVDHTLGTTSGYYLYFESSGTSGSWPNGAILRSPEITLDGSPTISWESSRYGATMGQTEVWWKVT
jgi:hypothetical protein